MEANTIVSKLKKQPDWGPLFDVVTISEAARMWNKNNKTVRRALSRPSVRFRKSGVIYLVSAESCRRLWGEPIYEHDDFV